MKWLSSDKIEPLPKAIKTGIKVAFIHNEKRIHTGMHTGAAQINRLITRWGTGASFLPTP